MTTWDRTEIEAAFRRYWQLGAVGERWDDWVEECFTEDVRYVEHVLGHDHRGREAVRSWIGPIMAEYPELYTAYEWHVVGDDGRVVVSMQNRRDHPDPTQPPIDFPGITVLEYGGDGRFAFEEDYWSLPEAVEASKRYAHAVAERPSGPPTRRDWGSGPEWTRP